MTAPAEVTRSMPRSTTKTKKAPPRPPSLDSARRLYLAAWVNPTEDGLQQARRSLVRRMWQARRAGAPTHRQALHDLYTRICTMQVRQEWNITPAERASRNRNLNDPHQYEREQRQRLGEPAFLHTSQPDREAHAYAPAAAPIPRAHTRIVHAKFSGRERREAERRARATAEAYYQALRDWRVLGGPGQEEVLKRREGHSTGEGRMRPILGNWSANPITIRHCVVEMPPHPKKQVDEKRLADLCNQDEILSAIRAGQTLSRLADPRGGWHQEKGRAVVYARAVLTMAFNLGDTRAQEHLRHLPVA